jgi:hypothetical protein
MADKYDRINPMFKGEDRSSALERRDQLVHQNIAKARTESEAKTVRLKALRLEKEAADKKAILPNPRAKNRWPQRSDFAICRTGAPRDPRKNRHRQVGDLVRLASRPSARRIGFEDGADLMDRIFLGFRHCCFPRCS